MEENDGWGNESRDQLRETLREIISDEIRLSNSSNAKDNMNYKNV
jgi:hypothetical protein